MADAVEALGSTCRRKRRMNSCGCKPHCLPAVRPVDAIIFPAERDAGVVGCDEAAVRDRDPVGVAGEIAQHLLRSGERRLAVDDPCDRESSGEENEHEVLKPFIAIQRVQLPPGKGQPTSRKRALHGVRRRPS